MSITGKECCFVANGICRNSKCGSFEQAPDAIGPECKTTAEFLKKADRPGPDLLKKARNLARVALKLRRVSADEEARRLSICSTCPERSGKMCVECGCSILKKARYAPECPLKKWKTE